MTRWIILGWDAGTNLLEIECCIRCVGQYRREDTSESRNGSSFVMSEMTQVTNDNRVSMSRGHEHHID